MMANSYEKVFKHHIQHKISMLKLNLENLLSLSKLSPLIWHNLALIEFTHCGEEKLNFSFHGLSTSMDVAFAGISKSRRGR